MGTFNITLIKTQEIQIEVEADNLEKAKETAILLVKMNGMKRLSMNIQTEYTALSEEE